MRVVTKNSVYQITPQGNGFHVQRIADMWGRAVKNDHAHVTNGLVLRVGAPMFTDELTTSTVAAVVA